MPSSPPTAAPWAAIARRSPTASRERRLGRFSEAFDRWRQLYESARAQLMEANRRSEMHGLPAAERKEAKIQQAQANEQIALLERGAATGGSDFYTYRYLATEGFLPGYNFPRLPLYAYVPAASGGGPKAAYPAARALPRHRRVRAAQPDLSRGPRLPGLQGEAAARASAPKTAAALRPTSSIVCDECGAAHQHDEPERCHACRRSDGRRPSDPQRPAHRQCRDAAGRAHHGQRRGSAAAGLRDPDRVRLAAARRQPRCHDGGGERRRRADSVARLRARARRSAASTRACDGARRRASSASASTPPPGAGPEARTKGDDDDARHGPHSQRVVPIVQDNKNALLLRSAGEPARPKLRMATLQHALARGLEVVFQLEEGEMSTEPVPRATAGAPSCFRGDRGRRRRAWPADERAEALVAGRARGAGAHALRRTSMPRSRPADPDSSTDEPDASCVEGCYRCLLSYYNQPDHELIDRTDRDAQVDAPVAPGAQRGQPIAQPAQA